MGDYKHIYEIKSPEYLKNKSIKELEELAQEIREFIIDKVSVNGGHLSANLGVVEATIAMHYVFDSPHDKIIFDVGHQAYVHKILTGRAREFDNLRTEKGISGFPKYSESVHDVFEVGHSSTSIGAMCGFLEEKRTNKDIGEVIAFIGDGSLQNGLALSGLNFLASQNKEKGIIIINDNEMSISKNVGGMAQTFNKLRIKRSFSLIRKLTSVSFRNAIKSIVYRNVNLFNKLGFMYLGPIDGHNLKDLIKYMQFAKKSNNSLILHLKTIKGKGYEYAENDKIGLYHGIGPFNKETGKLKLSLKEDEISFSKGIGKILASKLNENEKIKVISPAMIYGTGLCDLAKDYPNQVIDVGICEENAVVMASAMARCGSIPFVTTYSTFFQRAYDEINHDVCRSDSHVIFLIDHSGLVSGDGNTHQGIFDLSMLLSLPNIIISAPSNLDEANQLIDIALNCNHPFVIRYPKAIVNNNLTDLKKISFGKWKEMKPITKMNILSYGPVINEIFNEIKTSDIGLINALFIKPIDEEMIKKLDNTTVYIYEEAIKENSLGTKVIEFAYQNKLNIDIKLISLDDYVSDGTLQELRERNNLDIKKLIKNINK